MKLVHEVLHDSMVQSSDDRCYGFNEFVLQIRRDDRECFKHCVLVGNAWLHSHHMLPRIRSDYGTREIYEKRRNNSGCNAFTVFLGMGGPQDIQHNDIRDPHELHVCKCVYNSVHRRLP